MKRIAEMLTGSSKKPAPSDFRCPITHSLMVNPMQASDGWTYEWSAIAKWCEDHDTSPLNPSVRLDISELKPNRSLRDAIQRMVESGDLEPAVREEWLAASTNLDSAAELHRSGRVVEAAELGHPAAMGELAARYHAGTGVLQDIPTALQWAHKAALAGSGIGQFRMGYAYHVGEGKPTDWVEALKYYTMASQNDISAAAANISQMYRVGGHGLLKSASKMVEWCGRSGSSSSLHLMGMCYYTGDGVPRNHAEARRNFKAAGDLSDAQYMLGKMLLRGEGGNVNFVEGIKYVERAAKQGHVDAITLKETILAAARV